jgi:putative CocE/NonD family hydrolase
MKHPLSRTAALCLAWFAAFVLLTAPAGVAAELVEETVSITMDDGVELEGTLMRPGGHGEHSTILVRTPYGRHQHEKEARFWAENGYAALIQDTRGKWGSDGEFAPFLNEAADGHSTLDWIVGREWSDGTVGMWGSSYLAYCQLVVAAKGHPALKSIMPISGWIQDEGQISHGGANHIMLSIPWILHEETQRVRSIRDYEMDEMFEYLPLIDVFKSVGIDSKIWCEEFDFSHLEQYSAENIEVPALHMTGWNDFVCRAALSVYEGALRGSAASSQKLLVGPWFHDQFWTTYTEVGDEDFGPQSAMGREKLHELSLKWFDLTLGKDPEGVADWPNVKLFLMGANEWRECGSWPLDSAARVSFFLGGDGPANSLGGYGRLLAGAPAESGFDTYLFDPMNPVPTNGGANMHFMLHLVGVKDQRQVEERDDVLVYTTPPLEKDMEIVGPVRAVLHASTEGRDTDFTAKLVEVRPGGYARIIEEGIIRASFRNGPERELLEPGRIYELRVDMGSTAILIPRGNRLRLEVSSSNFPKYDRNPNTGEEALLARELSSVTQKVYHGGEYPSRVEFYAIERKGD